MKPLEVFSNISRYRLCAVSQRHAGCDGVGLGSGTALVHKGDLFVVTCAHVANPEDDGVELGSVIFDGAPPVGPDQLEVAFLDRDLDLALLRVSKAARHRLQHLQPIEVESLATMEQFAAAQPADGHGYAFIGSPWESRKEQGYGVLFRTIAYRARVKSNDGVRRLTLSYEAGANEEPLPAPGGISGCTLFMLDTPEGPGLWTPGKAIAVQHHWNKGEKHVICSPIAPIREFLLRG